MKYATISVSLLMIIAVLIPGSNLPSVNLIGFDKVVHVGMFGLWSWAVRYDFDGKNFKIAYAFFAGLLFSLVTEMLQVFAEGRTFDWFDVLADVIGLLIGLVTGRPVMKMLRKGNR